MAFGYLRVRQETVEYSHLFHNSVLERDRVIVKFDSCGTQCGLSGLMMDVIFNINIYIQNYIQGHILIF